jgi:hypothetical protein
MALSDPGHAGLGIQINPQTTRGLGAKQKAEVNFYFLFSVQSQTANTAVTMKAGMLGHIGNTTALAVTFT